MRQEPVREAEKITEMASNRGLSRGALLSSLFSKQSSFAVLNATCFLLSLRQTTEIPAQTASQHSQLSLCLPASLIHFSSRDQSRHNQLFRHRSDIDKNTETKCNYCPTSYPGGTIHREFIIRVAQYEMNCAKNCLNCTIYIQLTICSHFA